MRALYWFREDLRLLDNPALTAMAQQADEAVFVFVIPSGSEWSQGEERMGDHRRRFMLESLADLDRELRGVGQQLRVLQGNPVECVLQTAKEWNPFPSSPMGCSDWQVCLKTRCVLKAAR